MGHCHVNTLKRDPAAQPQERVGKAGDRTVARGTVLPSNTSLVQDSGGNVHNVKGNNESRKNTWADIVRKGCVAEKGDKKIGFVLSSLSRNNPGI